jgi:hypothetical protein
MKRNQVYQSFDKVNLQNDRFLGQMGKFRYARKEEGKSVLKNLASIQQLNHGNNMSKKMSIIIKNENTDTE